ncbi:hypothetical protein EYR40_004510 [Pleurotus pulmonarius]|nr:hypothetical protein EYR36_006924 [Pleurotus pulmonarius]KAF4584516.1 hypothetical protein EYR38_001744 [Pleurotus pulmonarius]KAF4605721.1 hypothetical protein EYR40_004510 [Pleurotus pulmonarius]KAF4607211.1 hypothetical protein EYR38_001271 [Pleurotus pulmonarius]
MTRLSIVKSLLSNQRDIRRQTIRVTLNFLTRDQTKQEMSERLGYDVEQLSTWVITCVAYPTSIYLIDSLTATDAIKAQMAHTSQSGDFGGAAGRPSRSTSTWMSGIVTKITPPG